jgi:hypothetical protein
MVMTYTTLVAAKAAAGSIMSWVNYAKLDVTTVLDEAQSLLAQILRVREMRTEWVFGVSAGNASTALPARFLDPIGRLYDLTNGIELSHRLETEIIESRAYDNTPSGSFGADPFTTTANSALVTVALVGHGLNQDSTIFISAADAVGGLSLNGAFPITTVVDANTITITATDDATSSATGGGAIATYTANNLIAADPTSWSVWDERLKLNSALLDPATFKLMYYRAPKLLSATNPSNFLTDRYPMLLRKACQASAADFMKDDTEYQKQIAALNNLIQSTAAQDDLIYRGASFGTDTP